MPYAENVCKQLPPYFGNSDESTYKIQRNLSYPINVGRNVAREAALTHYILVSDIENYPSPDVTNKFLEMVALNDKFSTPKVYPLPVFRIRDDSSVPLTKTELQRMLENEEAIANQKFPMINEWIKAQEFDSIDVFYITTQKPAFSNWHPVFIGTNLDPLYEEQLTSEGGADRMSQV